MRNARIEEAASLGAAFSSTNYELRTVNYEL
jgi:hypothetical protein